MAALTPRVFRLRGFAKIGSSTHQEWLAGQFTLAALRPWSNEAMPKKSQKSTSELLGFCGDGHTLGDEFHHV
jgi:hypothetical protein